MGPVFSLEVLNQQQMSSVTSASTSEKHTCHICGYQSLKKTHLKLHEQAVHDGKKFQCPECEYQATKKGNLGRHHQVVHMDRKEEQSKCEKI